MRRESEKLHNILKKIHDKKIARIFYHADVAWSAFSGI